MDILYFLAGFRGAGADRGLGQHTMPLRSGVISHLLEHFRDVEEAKLAGIVLLQRVQLACRDLIALDGVRLGKIGTHIVDKAAGDRGRQFNWFRHVPDIVDLTLIANPEAVRTIPRRAVRWGNRDRRGWQVMVMGDSLPCTMTLAR
jgi:hypothetical protein